MNERADMRAPSFVLALALIVAACGAEQAADEAPVARPVKMLTIGGGTARGVLEYPGAIQASQNAELSFEVPGRMIEFPVNEGQQVSQGQLLGRLDPRDYEADRDAKEAAMKAARADYDRYRELYAADAVTQQELEQKRRNFELTEARTRIARKALDDTYLRAPFAGLVARKLVDDFANVQAKERILVLQDESNLEVVVNVPERDWVLVTPGLSLEERTARSRPLVELSSLPGRQIPARIREFATTADPVTRTYSVTVSFDPPSDVTILPGMTAKVIATASGDVAEPHTFSVPASAVLSDEARNPFVWLVDQGTMTVTRNPVVLGEIAGSQVQVHSGLESSDLIAVSGVHNLREAMLVRRLED